MSCCNHHDYPDVGALDLAEGEEAEVERFDVRGDGCTCAHGLVIDDGGVM